MGFYSYITNDTNRSISNEFSKYPTFRVYLCSPDGRIWEENNYEGYGEFGGQEIYELIAELNGLETRSEAIALFHNKSRELILPQLLENPSLFDKTVNKLICCPEQGYFYD